MASQTFEKWLAELLGQSELEVERLLRDQAAVRFLIAWSMFEAACFSGFMKGSQIPAFSERVGNEQGFDPSQIDEALRHFHDRYQNKKLYKNLLHKDKSERLEALLAKPVESFSAEEAVFLVTFVVYRFRNNIFHSNKGVASWLEYKPQIHLCIGVMQSFVSQSAAAAKVEAA